MKAKLPAGYEFMMEDVLFFLRAQPKTMLRKEDIAIYCGCEYDGTIDRYVRIVVNRLRDEGWPIVSTSGQAGYSYDPDRVGEIIADLESRIIDMSATIRALRRGHVQDVQMKLEVE